MAKKRVLLVDDEPAFCRVMRRHLEQTGAYEVEIESDSTRVLAVARRFKPDLVVLDVIMPDVDGGEVAAQLRADQQLSNVRVVFLTAIVSKDGVGKEAEVIGGQTFLAKPVRAEELIRCIEEKLAA